MKTIGMAVGMLAIMPMGMRISSCRLCAIDEGFESGLAAWEADSDVPEDPNNPGQPVAWSITQSDEQASEGSHSARFDLDGQQDDGTIWLVRSLDVTAGGRHLVSVSFDFWSPSESFNTIAKVVAFAGDEPPEAEADFNTADAPPANQVEGWRRYAFAFPGVRGGNDGRVWVAFGISAVWETEMTYYIDNVCIRALPR